MRRPSLKTRLILCIALAMVLAGAISLPDVRAALLRKAGWALVAADALEPVDIIVLSVDADGAGVLEAADLVQTGVASQVALFADPPTGSDLEFQRRGLPYFNAASVSRQQLHLLGVKDVQEIPSAVNGTVEESGLLAEWCDQHRFRNVLFISASDHSRRTRRLVGRAMAGHATRVLVRYSRYSEFDPDKWWLTRAGLRIGIVELEKLLLDLVSHPFS